MSVNNSIVNTILKHSRCIVAKSKPTDDKYIQEAFDSFLGLLSDHNFNDKLVDKKLTELNHLLETADSADKFYTLPLIIIGRLNSIEESLAQKELNDFSNNILPYITENLSDLYNNIDSFGLTEAQTKLLNENVKNYIIADRILVNHHNISKRFNITNVIESARNKSIDAVVDEVYDLIDTYDLKSYQKMNVCIEEMVYVLGKTGIDYDKSDLVKTITERFLIDNTNTEKDMIGYKKVLSESYMLENADLDKVKYFLEGDESFPDQPANTIASCIDGFIAGTAKSDEDMFNLAVSIANNVSLNDMKFNIGLFFDFVDRFTRTNTLPAIQVIDIFFDTLCTRVEEFSRDDVDDLVESILKGSYEDSQIAEAIDNGIAKLRDATEYLYTRTNLEAMAYVNSSDNRLLPVSEYTKFKFTNLVKAAMNLEKLVKSKLKGFRPKNKKTRFVKKARDILFGEGFDILQVVGEDWKPDITVAQFVIEEGADENEVHELFGSVCKEFNDTLKMGEKYRAFYIVKPRVVEVHLKENVCLDLTLEEFEINSHVEDDDSALFIESFGKCSIYIRALEGFCEDSLMKNVDLTLDAYKLIIEAMRYADYSREDVQIFSENYTRHKYESILESGDSSIMEEFVAESEEIQTVIDNYEQFDVTIPDEIKLEAMVMIKELLEDTGIKKPNIKKPDIKKPDASKAQSSVADKAKDIAKKGKETIQSGDQKIISRLNTIKLGFEDLKSKAKNLSQKEKEASKTLDMYAAQFTKAVKSALTSDRREGIIKGSVIPSFSKCLKIGIGFAGVFVFNPLLAIIAAFGGLAMSKKLNKRERNLMLDEIEIELDVVEKEIANAENRGQMKKYRSLIKYKKELQRTYQRIKYNISADRDILPGSSVGIKGQE